jgi:hypothetical protein
MHQQVPMEDAIVKPIGGRKKWHRGRHLAAGCRREPKELTRGDCGSQRKLAATCRKVSRHARVAWCKRNIITNNWIRDKVWWGTRIVQTLRKRLRTCQEGRMGIKDLGGRRPIYLRISIEWTWENCGSLKELGAAGIRMIHHAKVAWRKEHGLQR